MSNINKLVSGILETNWTPPKGPGSHVSNNQIHQHRTGMSPTKKALLIGGIAAAALGPKMIKGYAGHRAERAYDQWSKTGNQQHRKAMINATKLADRADAFDILRSPYSYRGSPTNDAMRKYDEMFDQLPEHHKNAIRSALKIGTTFAFHKFTRMMKQQYGYDIPKNQSEDVLHYLNLIATGGKDVDHRKFKPNQQHQQQNKKQQYYPGSKIKKPPYFISPY